MKLVYLAYRHDNEATTEAFVINLARRLLNNGIIPICDINPTKITSDKIDQNLINEINKIHLNYYNGTVSDWIEHWFKAADKVLLISTIGVYDAWTSVENNSSGTYFIKERNLIKSHIDNNSGKNYKIRAIINTSEDEAHIPADLKGFKYYCFCNNQDWNDCLNWTNSIEGLINPCTTRQLEPPNRQSEVECINDVLSNDSDERNILIFGDKGYGKTEIFSLFLSSYTNSQIFFIYANFRFSLEKPKIIKAIINTLAFIYPDIKKLNENDEETVLKILDTLSFTRKEIKICLIADDYDLAPLEIKIWLDTHFKRRTNKQFPSVKYITTSSPPILCNLHGDKILDLTKISNPADWIRFIKTQNRLSQISNYPLDNILKITDGHAGLTRCMIEIYATLKEIPRSIPADVNALQNGESSATTNTSYMIINKYLEIIDERLRVILTTASIPHYFNTKAIDDLLLTIGLENPNISELTEHFLVESCAIPFDNVTNVLSKKYWAIKEFSRKEFRIYLLKNYPDQIKIQSNVALQYFKNNEQNFPFEYLYHQIFLNALNENPEQNVSIDGKKLITILFEKLSHPGHARDMISRLVKELLEEIPDSRILQIAESYLTLLAIDEDGGENFSDAEIMLFTSFASYLDEQSLEYCKMETLLRLAKLLLSNYHLIPAIDISTDIQNNISSYINAALIDDEYYNYCLCETKAIINNASIMIKSSLDNIDQ